MPVASRTAELIQKHEGEILQDWVQAQMIAVTARPDLMQKAELEDQSRAMLQSLKHALASGDTDEIKSSGWQGVRDTLATISQLRARQGFSPSETATFVAARAAGELCEGVVGFSLQTAALAVEDAAAIAQGIARFQAAQGGVGEA